MNLMIGIISYLPNETKVRTKRIEASRKQVEWLNKILPNVYTMIIAQGYTQECGEWCMLNRSNCNLYFYENGIGAGPARNEILKYFYRSDYEWLLLLDDDTTAYEYYHYENLFKEVINNSNKFIEIDAISAVEPEYHAYKKLNYEDKGNLTHFKFEPRELNSGSATSIIRNIKKFYNKEIYYPNVDANKGEGREDIEFLLEWLLSNLTWYTMDTWIRKSLSFDQSSIFGLDTKARDKLLMHDLDVVCEKYKQFGLSRGTNGKITWGAFNKVYNKSEKVLYIPREENIEYDENVIPKEKVTNNKRLF